MMSPLEDMAQDALERCVAKAETAGLFTEPLCWIGRGLSALMTHESNWATTVDNEPPPVHWRLICLSPATFSADLAGTSSR